VWPAVVAHRGASAHHPENTLAAFDAAVDAGADIVELDVRRTVDGGLVVIHDPTIALASGGSVPVSDLTVAEIRRRRPEIPSLDEVLERLRGRVALEVEIKNDPNEAGYEPGGTGIARGVVAAVRRRAFTDAFIASFDPQCLRSVKEIDREFPTGLLVDPARDLDHALEVTVTGGHAFLLPAATAFVSAGRAFVDHARDRNILICTWTVDDPTAIAHLFELGVDAVETNDPAVGVKIRDRVRES
jgi:glycerophosphoryl diester phosphodiesterase